MSVNVSVGDTIVANAQAGKASLDVVAVLGNRILVSVIEADTNEIEDEWKERPYLEPHQLNQDHIKIIEKSD